MHMRTNRVGITGFLAAFLFVGMLGCGKETVRSAAPVASALAPTGGATGVAVNQAITATFSEAMNPATINTGSFTVSGPGGALVGSVSYNAAGSVTTFVPSANFAYNTTYTATISTAAANTLGIRTASNYSWTFTTITAPPTVVSTVPSPGATGVAVTQALSATFSEAMSPATINGTTFTVSGPSGTIAGAVTYNATGSIATFTPSTSLAYGTLYTARITTGAQDLAGTGLAAVYSWTFTTLAPPLTVTSTVPVNGATGVPVTQALGASFSQALNCTTITSPAATFVVTGPGTTPVAGAVTCSGNVATFTPSANLAYNTLYTAAITTGAADTAGMVLAGNYVWSFITVPAPTQPTVIATVPANLATNVPIGQAVLATFSEAMTASTINTSTFTLAGPGSTAVTGTVVYTASGSVATFTPSANLAYSTVYTATITTGVTGLTGAAMASNYVWTFTTASAPTGIAPMIVSTIPVNLATNVPLNQLVSATFNQPMDPATINSTNFTLQAAGGAAVTGIVAYAAVGNTLTFTPAANLTASTQYTATITTGVKNLSGVALASSYIWTFTTGTANNTTPPELVSTFPANAATDVPLSQAVSGTFNEAMNPLTISTSTFTLTGSGSTTVTGTVSYDAIHFIATFTPNSNLLPNTQYTANLTSGVMDLSGNSLSTTGGVPNPWVFTTGTAVTIGPGPVNLGSAALFGIFGGTAGITNSGSFTVINGDIGTTAVSTGVVDFHDAAGCSYGESPVYTGGLVAGTIYTAPPPPTLNCSPPNGEGTAATYATAQQAAADALIAYNAITPASMPGGLAVETCPGCGGVGGGAGELGNRTLAPGVYVSTPGTYAITAGPLTLDAQGNPNAVWVFQMGTSLTVGSPSSNESIILTNGAKASNVYWQVGSSATIDGILGGGTMVGTVIAQDGVSVSTAGVAQVTTVDGRLLSLGASVTVVNTVINVPAN